MVTWLRPRVSPHHGTGVRSHSGHGTVVGPHMPGSSVRKCGDNCQKGLKWEATTDQLRIMEHKSCFLLNMFMVIRTKNRICEAMMDHRIKDPAEGKPPALQRSPECPMSKPTTPQLQSTTSSEIHTQNELQTFRAATKKANKRKQNINI